MTMKSLDEFQHSFMPTQRSVFSVKNLCLILKVATLYFSQLAQNTEYLTLSTLTLLDDNCVEII